MDHEPEKFDEPGLKEAIRREVGDAGASADLRKRVEFALRGEAAARKPLPFRRMWFAVAAAAVVILSLGVALQVLVNDPAAPRSVQLTDVQIIERNAAAFDLMIESAAHKPDVQSLSVAELSQRVGTTIATLDGETFKEVDRGLIEFMASPAARIEYATAAGRTIVVYTFRSAYLSKSYDGFSYDLTRAGGRIVGTVTGPAAHCFVAPADATDEEIAAIRAALRIES